MAGAVAEAAPAELHTGLIGSLRSEHETVKKFSVPMQNGQPLSYVTTMLAQSTLVVGRRTGRKCATCELINKKALVADTSCIVLLNTGAEILGDAGGLLYQSPSINEPLR